jgi:hypothetical protein
METYLKNSEKTDRPIADFLANLAEVGTDLIVENEALKELPVVEWGIKLLKAVDGVRSVFFARKIEKFIKEPTLIAAAEARKESGKVFADDEYAHEIGETLLMVLDKVTDLQKPVLLAKVYAAFLNEHIKLDMLRMLTHMIDISSILDLELFIKSRFRDPGNATGWRDRLVSSGVFYLDYDNRIGAPARPAIKLTALGKAFNKVLDTSAY